MVCYVLLHTKVCPLNKIMAVDTVFRLTLLLVLKEYPKILRIIPSEVLRPTNVANPWSEHSLRTLLQSLLNVEDTKLCFFIDGFDEFENARRAANMKIVNLIRSMTEEFQRCLKYRASSRPLKTFDIVLDTHPTLIMEHANGRDIEIFVRQELGDPAREADFVNEILDAAGGLFLWVRLAVESLEAGQAYGDPRDVLRTRLRQLPGDLEELYLHMLKRLDPIYLLEVSLYFNIIMNNQMKDDRSVLRLVLMTCSAYISQIQAPWSTQRAASLWSDCEIVEDWIRVRSGDLLEVSEPDSPLIGEAESTSYDKFQQAFLTREIRWMHRSAAGFVNDRCQELLARCKPFELYNRIIRGSSVLLSLDQAFEFDVWSPRFLAYRPIYIDTLAIAASAPALEDCTSSANAQQ